MSAPENPGIEVWSGTLPEDVVSFLTDSPGCGLMIRGAPGTGKTTLALQLLVALRPIMGGYYLSPRVGESMLLTHFPWLKDKAKEGEALSTTDSEEGVKYDTPVDAGGEGAARALERHELRQLEMASVGEEDALSPAAPIEGESMESALFPELDLAYRIVEQNLPQRTAVVVDSLDALALRYRLSESRLYGALSRDLVEAAGVALICVLEAAEAGIEYLGDGVVELSMDVVDGSRTRTMLIKKLRGRQIRRPFQPFTLVGGKIHTFDTAWEPPFTLKGIERFIRATKELEQPPAKRPPPRPVRLLDYFVDGLDEGKSLALELQANTPGWARDRAELITVAWAGVSGRPALVVGPRHRTASENRKLYGYFEHLFDNERKLRIASFVGRGGAIPEEWVFALEGRDLVSDLSWSSIRAGASDQTPPEVVFMDMDVVEAHYGPDAVKSSGAAVVQDLASHGATCVIVWREGFDGKRTMVNAATRHTRLLMLHGSLGYVGVQPQTPVMMLAAEPDPKEGAMLWPVF